MADRQEDLPDASTPASAPTSASSATRTSAPASSSASTGNGAAELRGADHPVVHTFAHVTNPVRAPTRTRSAPTSSGSGSSRCGSLLITNPAAARTQPRAVDAVMRDHAPRPAGRPRCSPPTARATRAASPQYGRGRGGGCRGGVRRRRHHHAGRRRAGGHRGGARRHSRGHRQPAGGQPPHPRLAGPRRAGAGHRAAPPVRPGPHGAGRRRSTTSPWPAARATTPGSWPARSSEHKRRWGMAAYVATTLRLIGEHPEHRPRHHHRRRGVRRQRRHGAGRQLRRGDPALRPARGRHPSRRRPARRGGGAGQQLRPERPGGLGPSPHGARMSRGWTPTWGTPEAGRSGSRATRSSRCSSTASPAARRPFTATVVPAGDPHHGAGG